MVCNVMPLYAQRWRNATTFGHLPETLDTKKGDPKAARSLVMGWISYPICEPVGTLRAARQPHLAQNYLGTLYPPAMF